MNKKTIFIYFCIPFRLLLILIFILFQKQVEFFYVILFLFAFIFSVINFQSKKLLNALIHSIIYILFVLLTIAEFQNVWLLLLFDVIFSIVNLYNNYYQIEDINLGTIKFGHGDLSENEKELEKMDEINESKKNPFSFIFKNTVLDQKREHIDNANEV